MQPTQRHPFLAPLWRRVATLGVSLAWLGLEIWGGNTTWIVITLFATGYAIWSLFIAYEVPGETGKE